VRPSVPYLELFCHGALDGRRVGIQEAEGLRESDVPFGDDAEQLVTVHHRQVAHDLGMILDASASVTE
jgi:hypothetical protein